MLIRIYLMDTSSNNPIPSLASPLTGGSRETLAAAAAATRTPPSSHPAVAAAGFPVVAAAPASKQVARQQRNLGQRQVRNQRRVHVRGAA